MAAGCWGYFLGGQFLTLDMGLTFFLTVAMLGFLLSRRSGIALSAERGWMILAWAGMACAVLSKGIVGIVIPALALLVYVALERSEERRVGKECRSGWGRCDYKEGEKRRIV